jgi:hypothetical protein
MHHQQKNGLQKLGNIFTAVRPQSQCIKSGNHAQVELITHQSWTALWPPTNSHVPHVNMGLLPMSLIKTSDINHVITKVMGQY